MLQERARTRRCRDHAGPHQRGASAHNIRDSETVDRASCGQVKPSIPSNSRSVQRLLWSSACPLGATRLEHHQSGLTSSIIQSDPAAAESASRSCLYPPTGFRRSTRDLSCALDCCRDPGAAVSGTTGSEDSASHPFLLRCMPSSCFLDVPAPDSGPGPAAPGAPGPKGGLPIEALLASAFSSCGRRRMTSGKEREATCCSRASDSLDSSSLPLQALPHSMLRTDK